MTQRTGTRPGQSQDRAIHPRSSKSVAGSLLIKLPTAVSKDAFGKKRKLNVELELHPRHSNLGYEFPN